MGRVDTLTFTKRLTALTALYRVEQINIIQEYGCDQGHIADAVCHYLVWYGKGRSFHFLTELILLGRYTLA